MEKRKPVTIQELAKLSGVSIATVSRVINHKGSVKEETRLHVLQVMQELNFYPKGILSTVKQSRIILTCVPDFHNPFNGFVVDGIQKAAHQNDYDVVLLQSQDYYTDISDFTNILENNFIAGILILSSVSNNNLLENLILKCPVVMCSECPEDCGISYVSIDDVQSAEMAVNYLISTGRRKIGLINSSLKFKYARHREKGYLSALRQAGLETQDAWITHVLSIDYNLAYSSILTILQLPDRPDALFACSDVYGIAGVNAAKSLGLRVPEDVAVVGFDDVATAEMSNPPLTTVKQPMFQMGYQACDLLMSQIRQPQTSNKQIILKTELLVRGSTALPK